ncbi:hypothetical protein ONS95_004090 [Cadophora gregata]|uniref:uncharacterized protein n=1 Tax=Cadophora gregata TaxID=51156 RepID=UPI0026DC6060|nr:uncharacterized protein ONS95_004090 [Cadophora gregata]KAK0105552.1 hypothetical protein ONS96_004937 [Cadophora gregata f. sp. sojae]KAK0105557.1 hypothetical protein ONS95_004090 [Cadophora gregata]
MIYPDFFSDIQQYLRKVLLQKRILKISTEYPCTSYTEERKKKNIQLMADTVDSLMRCMCKTRIADDPKDGQHQGSCTCLSVHPEKIVDPSSSPVFPLLREIIIEFHGREGS